MQKSRLSALGLVCLVTVLGLVAIVPGVLAGGTITGLVPAKPQPAASALKPGLAVTYYYGIVNSIDELTTIAKYSNGSPGKPIPRLDYHVGEGKVLTSNFNNGVGAFIEGLINCPEAGTYVFKLQSNDGVKLVIGGQLIHQDPGVHADTFSDPIPVKIDKPGWYPLSIVYFEKRHTSTLELYWARPGESDPASLVPAEALAHLAK